MYSGEEYRGRFDRSPRRSVRRIYDLKTIDFANTPSGTRRSATCNRFPSTRVGSGYGSGYNNGYNNGYSSGYNSGYGSSYNNGYDSGGSTSNYNFGNNLYPSASSRTLGPDSHRRSWNRPLSSLMSEAEADLHTMTHARSRLFKMADDALSVLNAIREGFNSPFEPRSRQRWGLDDLFGPNADDDIPTPTQRNYRSPIVTDDCVKRTRPRWSTLVDDDPELFDCNTSVNTLRRSPMPSTSEVLARLETPTDFPPLRCGGRLSTDYRTDPTRMYYRCSDKPKDLDGLRNARRQYFEQHNDIENGAERRVPIIVDEQTRNDAPVAPTFSPPSVKVPVAVENESHLPPVPTHTTAPTAAAAAPSPTSTPKFITTVSPSSTQNIEDAKWSGRDVSFDLSKDYSFVKTAEISKEKCSRLEEENSKLKDLVHNVTEINKRWQTFSSERETYIDELKATIERQQEQLNQCMELLRLAKSGQKQSEGQRTENSNFQHSASYEQLKERLREIIEPKATEEELSQLQTEVARLQKRLEETKKEHSELIGAYQQVKIQNSGSEESKETIIPKGGYPMYRSFSTDSNTTIENTSNKFFTPISASSTPETKPRSPSPLRDVDCDIQSEPKLSDRRNVPENEKDLFKYAFDSANLRNRQEDVYGLRHSSPADGLSPTPTPTPGATRYIPLEVSGSASSLASAVPVVSIPPSSRESSVDRDISICSDATIDCSPPSPVPVTVGYDNGGLATVTTFRTVPIVRADSPDRKSDDSDGSVKSVIETKTERRPTSFVEEEEICSLVSPRGVLARTTSTQGASTDGEGNGRSWSSDIFSRRLSADTVSCPKCGNTYPPSKYLQLMIHLDNCRTATGSPGVTLQELALGAINHIMNS